MSTQRTHPRGTASLVEPPGGHSEVQAFLARIARALTEGDGSTVAGMWAVPALVLGDDEVRWPYLDGQGNEVGEEVSTYTLRRDETGALKVQVALMQGVSSER